MHGNDGAGSLQQVQHVPTRRLSTAAVQLADRVLGKQTAERPLPWGRRGRATLVAPVHAAAAPEVTCRRSRSPVPFAGLQAQQCLQLQCLQQQTRPSRIGCATSGSWPCS